MKTTKTIGELIREHKKLAGYSIRDLANKSGKNEYFRYFQKGNQKNSLASVE